MARDSVYLYTAIQGLTTRKTTSMLSQYIVQMNVAPVVCVYNSPERNSSVLYRQGEAARRPTLSILSGSNFFSNIHYGFRTYLRSEAVREVRAGLS